MGLPKMQAHLNIFPGNKIAFINFNDNYNAIMLQYSRDIKDIEFQLLFHGYKILEKKKNIFRSVDNYLEVFDLEPI